MKEEQSNRSVRRSWPSFLEKFSYQALVGNVPYLAFLALVSTIYIHNTQRAVTLQKSLNEEQEQLKELRWKYMDLKTQLLNLEVENKVVDRAAGLGLKPLSLPAYLLIADSSINRISPLGN